MNIPFHVAAADGAWRCPTDGTSPTFVATRAPTRDDLLAVIERVARRVASKMERGEEQASDGADPLAGCCRVATTRGTFGVVRGQRHEDEADVGGGGDDGSARYGRRPPKAFVAELEGFNLHAGVVIGAKDRDGLERLLRYMARPAVVLERVSELDDGRVAWKLKMPGSRGETHRIMDPKEFMARLAARPAAEVPAGAVPRRIRAEFTVESGDRPGTAAIHDVVRGGHGEGGAVYGEASRRREHTTRATVGGALPDWFGADELRRRAGVAHASRSRGEEVRRALGRRTPEAGLGIIVETRLGLGCPRVPEVPGQASIRCRHPAAAGDRTDPRPPGAAVGADRGGPVAVDWTTRAELRSGQAHQRLPRQPERRREGDVRLDSAPERRWNRSSWRMLAKDRVPRRWN